MTPYSMTATSSTSRSWHPVDDVPRRLRKGRRWRLAATVHDASERIRTRTRSGVPRGVRDVRVHPKEPDIDGYDWGVDVAGQISLGGLKLLLSNRASIRIRSPLRLT